jgi:hypothetical protein
MALLHAIADTALAKAAVYEPTGLTTAKIVVIALLVGAAALWSAVDGWRRLRDRGRTWVIAALVAGEASAVLSVIGQATLVDQSGTSQLWPALTGGAAFTALLVLIPAGLGMFAGGQLQPMRRPSPTPRSRPAPGPRPVKATGRAGRRAVEAADREPDAQVP